MSIKHGNIWQINQREKVSCKASTGILRTKPNKPPMHALLLMYFTQICCAVKGLCIHSVMDRCTTLQPYRENFIKPKIATTLFFLLVFFAFKCSTISCSFFCVFKKFSYGLCKWWLNTIL